MTGQNHNEYAGIWYCAYAYPSNNHEGEDLSEYYATVHQRGSTLTIQSIPNKLGSYLFVKLHVDGALATGTWEENTSPDGEFAGSTYSGAMQLIISDDNDHMDGQWVGVGKEDGKHKIFHGRWIMRRAGSKELASAKTA